MSENDAHHLHQLEYHRARPATLRERLNRLHKEAMAILFEHASRWRGIAATGAAMMLAHIAFTGFLQGSVELTGKGYRSDEPLQISEDMGAHMTEVPRPFGLEWRYVPGPLRYIAYASLFACTWYMVMLAVVALKRANASGGSARRASLTAFVLVCVEWVVMVAYFGLARL